MSPLTRALLARRGTREWDAVLRLSGLAAALAIYPTLRWPEVAGLVGFFCIALFMHGPISPVLPAAFEPVLMLAGRAFPPLLIALVGTVGCLYMDYVNYHLYGAALRHPRLERARTSAIVQRTLALFRRSPFFAVWVCAWSPIPDWIATCLAPLERYPMDRYLLAKFLGRMPRLWFFAALGLVVPVSTQVLATFTIAAVGIGVVIIWCRRGVLRPRHLVLPPAVQPSP